MLKYIHYVNTLTELPISQIKNKFECFIALPPPTYRISNLKPASVWVSQFCNVPAIIELLLLALKSVLSIIVALFFSYYNEFNTVNASVGYRVFCVMQNRKK